MKAKSTLGVAVAALAAAAVGVAAPANAAQGGDDRSGGPANQHAWIKVGRDQIDHESQACTEVFGSGYPNFRPCDHFAPLLTQEKWSHPNAAGYWAEWYYNTGQTRSGTW